MSLEVPDTSLPRIFAGQRYGVLLLPDMRAIPIGENIQIDHAYQNKIVQLACSELSAPTLLTDDKKVVVFEEEGYRELEGYIRVSQDTSGRNLVAITSEGLLEDLVDSDLQVPEEFSSLKFKEVVVGETFGAAIELTGRVHTWGDITLDPPIPPTLDAKKVFISYDSVFIIDRFAKLHIFTETNTPPRSLLNIVNSGSVFDVAISEGINEPDEYSIHVLYIKDNVSKIISIGPAAEIRHPTSVEFFSIASGEGFTMGVVQGPEADTYGILIWGEGEVYERLLPIVLEYNNSIDDRPIDESPRRSLNFSDVSPVVPTRTRTLSGRRDPALNPQLTPFIRSNLTDPTPLPAIPGVYDSYSTEEVPVGDFLTEHRGNALVFRSGTAQYGTFLSQIIKDVHTNESVFYECTRLAEYTGEDGSGTFEYGDILRQAYVRLSVPHSVYVKLEDVQEHIMGIPMPQLLEVVPTDQTLAFTASHTGVVAGGPIASQAHCQAGTNVKVSTLRPFVPATAVSDPAPEAPRPITLQKGETRTTTLKTQVGEIRAEYAESAGITPSRVKFIFGGRVLADTDSVAPGSTILVMVSGGRRTYRRKLRR